MKKFALYIICSLVAVGCYGMPAGAIDAVEENCLNGTATTNCLPAETKVEPRTTEPTDEPRPTFTAELNKAKQTSGLWAGKNFLLAGNELTSYTDVKNGLLFAAGNTLQLSGISEYGFVAGNIVNFSGTTSRDLYIAGNIVTLTKDAKIGRDVFVAGNELYVNTSLDGDLSVTAAKVILADDVTIRGNVNLDASEISVGKNIMIDGTLTYNDSATTDGLENVEAGQTEIYHIEEVSASTRIAVALYAKFLSIAGLFLAIVLVSLVCPKLRTKVQESANKEHLLANTMCGLGALAVIPVVAIFALFTIVGAPVGIIILAFYMLGTYLAQGITGIWLGHAIFSKFPKLKVNFYLEALVGITLLGLIALIPFVSIATGFVSLAFGFGTIISYIKTARIVQGKDAKSDKPSAKPKKSTKK